ncbi:glycoside hydrolase family 61 protein [Tricladium varicosporioides]|nr:glycoside hydrolase family 61 protein [Hymenoscyphus varicosporioides]
MILIVALFICALLSRHTYAHYVFSQLLVNGSTTGNFTYIREDGWATKYDPQITNPDMFTTNITCGRSAEGFAKSTKTATVLAGSQVGFRVWEVNVWIGHEGPAQIYMSRAPNDDIENYQGDGEWFKIAYLGPSNDTNWSVEYQSDVNFTIPLTTPPGKYLLRIEHIWPMHTKGYAQHYVNCAHIKVIGPGGGTPTGFAKFPGTYTETDQGLLIPRSMAISPQKGLLSYVPPGPKVWTGKLH